MPKPSGVHVLPANTQAPEACSQTEPATQSALELQRVRQVPSALSQRNSPQSCSTLDSHTPAPSQRDSMTELLSQPFFPHSAPFFANRLQLPAPSHVPSPPHSMPDATHPPRGLSPGRVLPHVPVDPVVLLAEVQLTQGPLHDVLQQTPSTQCPELHWSELSHGSPSDRFPTHPPATHTYPGAQSWVPRHGTAHLPSAQTAAPQSCSTGTHVPAPSHWGTPTSPLT